MGEPTDRERLNRSTGAAGADQFGHHVADAGAELEAVAAEAERVEQAVDRTAWAHDRQGIRQVTFDTAPDPDDVQVADARQQTAHLLHLVEDAARLNIGPTIEHVRFAAVAAADDDVAAGDLPEVDHFLGNLGVHADYRWQGVGHRFGHSHLRAVGVEWHRLAKLLGQLLPPGPGGNQQLCGVELTTIGGGDIELAADLLHFGDFGLFFNLRAESTGSTGKRRGGQTRVGVAIVRRVGTTLHVRPEERKALMQLSAAIDFQVELRRLRCCRIRLKLSDFVFAITHAHVPAGDEFEVIVDQFRQALPQRPGTVGQFQLPQIATLTPDVAEVHAAGVLTDLVTFQQDHRLPATTQEKRCRRAHQAAADNHHIGFLNGHGETSSVSIERGLTGAWPRWRPTCCTLTPAAAAITSAPAWEQ